jgi:type II secretory pathway component PulF
LIVGAEKGGRGDSRPLGGLAASTAVLSFVVVPAMIRQSLGHLPANAQAVPALVQFAGFRNLWLAVGGGLLVLVAAAAAMTAGALGRARCHRLLQDLRLVLPGLRAHAVAASRARLLEALACEQQAGLPADDTLRRLARREPVPRLAAALDLAAARLAAGDAWTVCLSGTLLDAPLLADLNALAGHGAHPTRGLQWAAGQSRERAVRALRRAVAAMAAAVLIPAFAYLLVLAHAASTTAAVAQVESLRLEIESFGDEVERVVGGSQPTDGGTW